MRIFRCRKAMLWKLIPDNKYLVLETPKNIFMLISKQIANQKSALKKQNALLIVKVIFFWLHNFINSVRLIFQVHLHKAHRVCGALSFPPILLL